MLLYLCPGPCSMFTESAFFHSSVLTQPLCPLNKGKLEEKPKRINVLKFFNNIYEYIGVSNDWGNIKCLHKREKWGKKWNICRLSTVAFRMENGKDESKRKLSIKFPFMPWIKWNVQTMENVRRNVLPAKQIRLRFNAMRIKPSKLTTKINNVHFIQFRRSFYAILNNECWIHAFMEHYIFTIIIFPTEWHCQNDNVSN